MVSPHEFKSRFAFGRIYRIAAIAVIGEMLSSSHP